MKTGKFTLMTAILVMAAVTGAAGQPARGNKNGNHEKNNRQEIAAQERREVRGAGALERNRPDRVEMQKKSFSHPSQREAIRHHHQGYTPYYRKHHVPKAFYGNKHYKYHPKYGHVIKRFAVPPVRIWAGQDPFWYSDGFFYRYHKGLGYVWVEEPWDIWFSALPYDAIRVRIGGHLYYRLGNAYFTAGPRGFRLAMLPDRYYHASPAIQITARF
ncbi:MAG TPA: hypothetical protein PKJ58_04780 [Prolixibacteraceae bacterium]|nr:hypothetical protein [Prolixibacteraceae bacterium]